VKRLLLRLVDPVLRSAPGTRFVVTLLRLWTSSVSRLAPDEGLRRLFAVDEHVRDRIDGLAIALDGGVHAKHRLTGYHGFFLARIEPGETVLDVGCGKGELAADLARHGAAVTGIDFDLAPLAVARGRETAGLELVHADALNWQPPHPFDVVVLSNVLEHIADRVGLLRSLTDRMRPERFLIRVPARDRDWIVPLREELGLFWFSDPTHETEYTLDQLRDELAEAGLQVDEVVQRWGELWAAARPSEGVTLAR
jgi:2-polyprenyl-3-methyl-5-hydroxy-6-metoxy-1,4-benzoquinol methylase